MTKDLDKWFNYELSLCSRISVIDMIVLPKINFEFRLLPLPAPPSY